MSNLVFGKGVNDVGETTGYVNNLGKWEQHKWYTHWRAMLQRVYESTNRSVTYEDCSVCDEWLLLSNFKRFHDKYYKIGYSLDKDFKVYGNRIYSEDNCLYIPTEVNAFLTHNKSTAGTLPIGVSKEAKTGRFIARLSKLSSRVYLGLFNTPEEAFAMYKEARIKYIHEITDELSTEFSEEVLSNMIKTVVMGFE